MLIHFDRRLLPGGFFGVDIFFVLSGYLVAASARTRSLKSFAKARFTRIVPPHFAFLTLTTLGAVTFGGGGTTADLLRALPMSAGYILNYDLARTFHPSVLAHTWSLCIEIHFYVIFALLWYAGLRRIGSRALLTIFALIATFIALYRFTFVPDHPLLVDMYYRTDFRLDPLFLGAAAYYTKQFIPRIQRSGHIIGALALLVLAAHLIFASPITPYPYRFGFTLVAVATALLVSQLHNQDLRQASTLITRIFTMRLLRWLGTRAYGAYLWHYPIVEALDRTRLPVAPIRFLSTMSLTLLAAELSFRTVERMHPAMAHRSLEGAGA